MRNVLEILAEIVRLIRTSPNDSYELALEEIKEFILSDKECEHNYAEHAIDGKSFFGCLKCGVTKNAT